MDFNLVWSKKRVVPVYRTVPHEIDTLVEDDPQCDKQKGIGTVISPDKDTGYEEQDEDNQTMEVDLTVIQYGIQENWPNGLSTISGSTLPRAQKIMTFWS